MPTLRNNEQLLLVRQLYEDAKLLLESKNRLSVTKAIILLDLSIEQLLNVIILNLDPDLTINQTKGSQEIDRRTLWGNASTALNKSKNKRLSEFREIANLHALRNLVQHIGTEPAQSEAIRYLEAAERMLSKSFSDAFDLDFQEFRLWDVITNNDLRGLLKDSEDYLNAGNPVICIAGCKLAHQLIVSAISENTQVGYFRQFTKPYGRAKRDAEEFKDFADYVKDNLANLHGQLELLEQELVAIGIGMSVLQARQFARTAIDIDVQIMDDEFMEISQTEVRSQEDYCREAKFMLDYLFRLIRLIEDSYPSVLANIEVVIPLSEQDFEKLPDTQLEY